MIDINLPSAPSKPEFNSGKLAALLILLAAPLAAQAQERPVPDTYEATTTGLSPDGVTLKIDVVDWSDDEAREAVIDALSQETDVQAALRDLPTIGAVWRSGSAVGHALKYAHKTMGDGGEERVTFVTESALDAFSFKPWTLAGDMDTHKLDYSVIELRLDGSGPGTGTLSFGAEVELDAEAHTVNLVEDDSTPQLLSNAQMKPKPYWARSQ